MSNLYLARGRTDSGYVEFIYPFPNFSVRYVAHAPIETFNAIAEFGESEGVRNELIQIFGAVERLTVNWLIGKGDVVTVTFPDKPKPGEITMQNYDADEQIRFIGKYIIPKKADTFYKITMKDDNGRVIFTYEGKVEQVEFNADANRPLEYAMSLAFVVGMIL